MGITREMDVEKSERSLRRANERTTRLGLVTCTIARDFGSPQAASSVTFTIGEQSALLTTTAAACLELAPRLFVVNSRFCASIAPFIYMRIHGCVV